MGYGDYHSHTADEVGAARSDHHHSAYDIGAAEDNHRHYPHDVGASPEGHEHALSQIAGAASEQELHELERRVNQLATALEAERALNEALRAGSTTVPALAQALRRHADDMQLMWGASQVNATGLAESFRILADNIEREAR